VAVQTNLSCRLDWLEGADLGTLALWCTYHPSQVTRERFLTKHRELTRRGVRHSVCIVGIVEQPEHLESARRLRTELDPATYALLSVNAAEGRAYTDAEAAQWTENRPAVPGVATCPPVASSACRTGESVISVDGAGRVRRRHFVSRTDPGGDLGNLYDGSFRNTLGPRPCPLLQCDCHIGHVHMPELGLYLVFGTGVLERAPERLPGWFPARGSADAEPRLNSSTR
jgi:hypothetical protein